MAMTRRPFPDLRGLLLCGTALAAAGPALAQAPNARPQGGVVSAGSATIAQDAARTQVNQATDRAVIDWRGFDVGRDHAVRFQQPNSGSMTLNRVNSADPSRIAGQVTANGGIAIVNQSGVIFAPGARVEAQSVIVSTADIANQRFMAGGRMVFDRPGRADARIVNEGSITAREAGIAALVAPQVANRGVISARLGTVAIAGAETHVIDLYGDGLMSIEITGAVRQRPADGSALVSNDGVLQADGGRVSLTAAAADGIVQNLVRAGGRVSANTDAATGRRGEVVVAGTGGAVIIEGQVEARGIAAGQRGGTIEVVADRVLAAAGARIDASGAAGGGEIAFGQTRQGSAAPRRAERTGVAAGAELRADATVLGQGGRIVLHSTDTTLMAGSISARGGPQGGDGGFVEVSGERGFQVLGSIDVSAPAGRPGQVLYDPDTLEIVPDDTPGLLTDADVEDGILAGDPPAAALISPRQIERVAGDLVLEAATSITVSAPVNKPGNLSLVTNPNGAITINANLVASGTLSLVTDTLTIAALVQADRVVLDGLSNIGAVTETGVGRIVANRLFATILSRSLNGDNQIGVLEDVGGNDITLRNIGSLVVEGIGLDGAGSMAIDVVNGDLTIRGPLSGGGQLADEVDPFAGRLRASGNILIEAGGSIQVNGIRILAGFDFGTGQPNLAAPGRIEIAAQVRSEYSDDPGGRLMDLAAGTGGIRTTGAGEFLADLLQVRSGGDVVLAGGGSQLDTLVGADIRGNFTLAAEGRFGASSIILAGAIGVTGTFDVTGNNAGLTQDVGSFITAAQVNAAATGAGNAVLLEGDNRIARLGDVTSGGDIRIRNLASLTVAGTLTGGGAGGDNVSVAVEGPGNALTVTGAVAAGGGLYALAAEGDVIIAAGASVTSSNGGQVASIIGAGLIGDFQPPNSASTLRLDGNVGMAGALNLAAGSGGIRQGGGGIAAGRLALLFGANGGDAMLDGGSNAIQTLAGVDVPGALRIVNGTNPLTIEAPVTAQLIEITAGILTLGVVGTTGITGSLTADTRIALRIDGLNLPNLGTTVVAAPEIEIAPATPRPMQVMLPDATPPAAGALALTETMLGQIAATELLRFGATTISGATAATASGLEVSGNIDFAGGPTLEVGRLDLRSLGDITQVNGTLLGADILTGQAGGAVTLPNVSLGYLDDLSAGGDIILSIGSLLRLRGLLSTPGMAALSTPNGIETTGAGRAVLGELRVNAVEGSVLLTGQNAVGRLGESDIFGDLVLVNTGPSLTIPSGSLVDVGGVGTVTATAGSVTVDGTIRASALSLTAPAGTVAVNGFSAIAFAGGLALAAQNVAVNGLIAGTSGIAVNATQAASLAGIAQTPSLSITSPSISFGGLDAAGSDVALFLGGSGSASGTLAAASLRVTDGSGAVLAGSIAGDTAGTAAALGRRFAGATQLGDPPPNQLDYVFNDCPIGASVCTRPQQPLPPTEPPVTRPTGSPFSFDIPAYTVADNPRGVLGELDPAGQPPANPLVQIPILPFVTQPGRDTSEDRELSPPNIRAEDF